MINEYILYARHVQFACSTLQTRRIRNVSTRIRRVNTSSNFFANCSLRIPTAIDSCQFWPLQKENKKGEGRGREANLGSAIDFPGERPLNVQLTLLLPSVGNWPDLRLWHARLIHPPPGPQAQTAVKASNSVLN